MSKPIFAAIPARAMGDERLSALDLRVLMAIAIHDRLTANGTGCFAGNGRLASLVGCHLKSLSRSLRSLAEAGYITGRDNPLNRRTREDNAPDGAVRLNC
jgi:DNA-binding MarR family transcriptional regulator